MFCEEIPFVSMLRASLAVSGKIWVTWISVAWRNIDIIRGSISLFWGAHIISYSYCKTSRLYNFFRSEHLLINWGAVSASSGKSNKRTKQHQLLLLPNCVPRKKCLFSTINTYRKVQKVITLLLPLAWIIRSDSNLELFNCRIKSFELGTRDIWIN